MADLFDVRQDLAQQLGAVFYPNGVPGGTNPASPVAGAMVRCYAGWPERDALDKDLRAGFVNVTVYQSGVSKDTTRFAAVDVVLTDGTATLAWAVTGTTVTLSGTISTPQNLALLVDGIGYTYQVQAADTLAGIASSFATAISANQTATASGATISIPHSHLISPRVGAVGTTIREVGRQSVRMQVTIWAPTPALRATCATAVQEYLVDLRRYALTDGSIASIIPAGERDDDMIEKALLYRRDCFYTIEYATTVPGISPQIILVKVNETVVTQINGPALTGTTTDYF